MAVRLAKNKCPCATWLVRYASTAAPKTPQITKPIGVEHLFAEEPKDARSFYNKVKDFFNYDNNLKRREAIKAELASSRFTPMHRFGATKGKFWQFPAAYSRADRSLYMPNIVGRTLVNSDEVSIIKLLQGKVSVLRLFTSTTGEKQTHSYFPESPYMMNEEQAQVVHINAVESYPKEVILRLLMRNLKRQFDEPKKWSRYLIARTSVTKEVRQSLMAENIYGGYVYLVDRSCKIRWAGCGEATPEERANLWRYVKTIAKEEQIESAKS